MANQKLTPAEALTLAKHFNRASYALTEYLYDNYLTLPVQKRDKLKSMIDTLLMVSGDLTTHAVGMVLDETQTSVLAVQKATKDATAAVKRINDIKQAIEITTSLILLATAIPTGNIGAIVAALKGVAGAVKPTDAKANGGQAAEAKPGGAKSAGVKSTGAKPG